MFTIQNSTTGITDSKNIVKDFRLYQNYPNPFNPSTVIKYDLPKESNVKIEIFNAIGQKVTTLLNASQNAGNYEIKWIANKFSSGIYFYSLKATDISGKSFFKVMKMLLLK